MREFNLEERVAKAKRLFREEGYNCCQAVVLAYNDLFDVNDLLASSIASGFGGGFGRLREVCGSVSGMTILAGMLYPADDPSDKAGRTRNYAIVQEIASKFKEINGSIVCKELLGLVPMGSNGTTPAESPVPSDRTAEYYQKRPCEELVGISARIIGEKLLESLNSDKN